MSGAAIDRCLGFEAGVLRRLDFFSVAIPFAGSGDLAWYLKLWRKRVLANDLARSTWWMVRALVDADNGQLGEEEVASLVEPAPSSSGVSTFDGRMPEADARWLDAVRARADEMGLGRARAMRTALLTASYALSFAAETAHVSRPLPEVFAELAREDRPPVESGTLSVASNLDAEAFVGRTRADLLYVRFPDPRGMAAWRGRPRGMLEAWTRGTDTFWPELEEAQRGRFGGAFSSKRAYLAAVDRFLGGATAFQAVAVLIDESGWITPSEFVGAIARHRKVRVTYTKDLTQAAGGRRLSVVVAE